MSALVRLYPPAWRARYGEEFEQLLQDRPLTPGDVSDVVVAAFDARLRAARGWFGGLGPAPSRPARVAAIAAVAGGILWVIAGLGFAIPDESLRGWIVLPTLAVAGLALFVAVIVLASFADRDVRTEAWLAVAVPAGACAGMVAGLVWMFVETVLAAPETDAARGLWASGALAFVVSSAFFAFVGRRLRILGSRTGLGLLAAALFGILELLGLGQLFRPFESLALFLAWTAFGVSWIAMGLEVAARPAPAGAREPVLVTPPQP